MHIINEGTIALHTNIAHATFRTFLKSPPAQLPFWNGKSLLVIWGQRLWETTWYSSSDVHQLWTQLPLPSDYEGLVNLR